MWKNVLQCFQNLKRHLKKLFPSNLLSHPQRATKPFNLKYFKKQTFNKCFIFHKLFHIHVMFSMFSMPVFLLEAH